NPREDLGNRGIPLRRTSGVRSFLHVVAQCCLYGQIAEQDRVADVRVPVLDLIREVHRALEESTTGVSRSAHRAYSRVRGARPTAERRDRGIPVAEAELQLVIHRAHVEELRSVDPPLTRRTEGRIAIERT